MATVRELVDRGARAYAAGRMKDARDAFEEALRLDPSNDDVRSFLVHVREQIPTLTPFPGASRSSAAAASTATGARSARGRAGARAGGAPGPPEESAPDGGYAPSPWDDGPAAAATIQIDGTTGALDLEAIAEKSDLRPLVPQGAGRASGEAPHGDVDVWMSAARELFQLGDFTGSLELIEKILQVDPDHAEARDYLRQNESTLISMYESKLGSMQEVPRLAINPEEVMWLNLDHRAGFLLAQIDGTVDYDSLFALSGLPRLDTARILAHLLSEGVITSR